jgi:hypothetical protein
LSNRVKKRKKWSWVRKQNGEADFSGVLIDRIP